MSTRVLRKGRSGASGGVDRAVGHCGGEELLATRSAVACVAACQCSVRARILLGFASLGSMGGLNPLFGHYSKS